MPHFKEVDAEAIKFYLQRTNSSTDNISVNKEFVSFYGSAAPTRYVYKQFEGNEKQEVVELQDELILTSTPKGRDQVRVTIFGSNGKDRDFVIQQYRYSKPLSGISLSFVRDEWHELLTFLDKLQFMDFSNPGNYTIRQSTISQRETITSEDKQLLYSLKSLGGDDRAAFLERLASAQAFTDEDLNVEVADELDLKHFVNSCTTRKIGMKRNGRSSLKRIRGFSGMDSTIVFCPYCKRKQRFLM